MVGRREVSDSGRCAAAVMSKTREMIGVTLGVSLDVVKISAVFSDAVTSSRLMVLRVLSRQYFSVVQAISPNMVGGRRSEPPLKRR